MKKNYAKTIEVELASEENLSSGNKELNYFWAFSIF